MGAKPSATRDDNGQPRPSTRRIEVLDGLRGLAILVVVLYHTRLYVVPPIPGASQFFARVQEYYTLVCNAGWLGVDLFFVLSGYLITGILVHTARETHYYRNFFVRRTLRIMPPYVTCLAILTVVVLCAPLSLKLAPASLALSIWPAWSYVLNWTVGLYGFPAASVLLSHFWSLSVEEQFYLFWPAVVRNLSLKTLSRVCVAIIVCSPLIRLCCYILIGPTAAYTFTICRLDAFAIGGFIAISSRRAEAWNQWTRAALWLAPICALGTLVIMRVDGDSHHGSPLINILGYTVAEIGFGALLINVVEAQ